ncbi:CHRD domain-containing protein [Engelhardtia mirabilis]|uniref:CHRD domain protein n=1 Tax=Engelhardtia mirabilis TaxID=2528011 RepID=A0A518BFC8_9BACT|nr:CHRD domain protein [Planctomycetes bacterium Pla133]QDU99987.1 CHRD domain protein [Planctomycetes bacterium Pla86]
MLATHQRSALERRAHEVSLPMFHRTLAAVGLLAALPLAASAQIVTGFSATVSGIEETPPNASANLGTAELTYDVGTGVLSCTVLTTMSTVTIAHVHDGDVGFGGPIVFGLNPVPGGWGGSGLLSAAQVDDLLRGGLYVNLHSAAFSGGEIRGQIRPPRHFVAFATGAKETPPNPSIGTANGRFEFDLATQQLSYDVVVKNVNATISHLHSAFPGSAGPIVVALDPNGPNGFKGTSPPLSSGEVLQLLAGGIYLNVHSPSFPGGEVRDQVHVGGLNADANRVGAANGIKLDMDVSVGPDAAGDLFWVLGSLSGTTPGLPVDGMNLPLNPDAYFLLTLNNPNQPPLSPSQGFLSGGQDLARFEIAPGVLTPLIGATLNHAFVGVDLGALVVNFASNAQALTIQ